MFVSGVAGLLGSYLADAFLADGWEVVEADNPTGGTSTTCPPGCRPITPTATTSRASESWMGGVDVVYHCAAAAYEGLSVFSPHFVTQSVVTATTGVMRRPPSRTGCGASCSARPWRATGPTTCRSPRTSSRARRTLYGIGKLAAEMLVRNLAETHGLERVVVAVPHNVIGPRQKYDDPYRNVAAIFANLLLQGRPLAIYGDGSQKRCFSVSCPTSSRLCDRWRPAPACVGEVINVGPDTEFVSVLELATIIARLMGVELEVRIPAAAPARGSRWRTAPRRRLATPPGYWPDVSLEDGLSRDDRLDPRAWTAVFPAPRRAGDRERRGPADLAEANALTEDGRP